MLITDLLSFSCLGLNFNSSHFPGEVAEEPLEVYNKASIEIGYKIHVHCKDDSLNDLDEYVFSMRKIGSYDYNDKYLVVQSPGVKSTYRIAMKVPNIKSLSQLEGSLVIFSDDCRGRVVMPIKSKVTTA